MAQLPPQPRPDAHDSWSNAHGAAPSPRPNPMKRGHCWFPWQPRYLPPCRQLRRQWPRILLPCTGMECGHCRFLALFSSVEMKRPPLLPSAAVPLPLPPSIPHGDGARTLPLPSLAAPSPFAQAKRSGPAFSFISGTERGSPAAAASLGVRAPSPLCRRARRRRPCVLLPHGDRARPATASV